MQRSCLKCGHVHPHASGAEMEPCPQCGAIYSRVEAVAAGGGVVRPVPAPAPKPKPPAAPVRAQKSEAPAPDPAPSAPAPHLRWGRAPREARAFLGELRAQSHYPAFRSIVTFFTVAGYVLAAVGVFVGVALIKNEATKSGISLVVAAFFWAFAARVFQEVFLMVADGCDALVRLAARQDANEPDPQ